MFFPVIDTEAYSLIDEPKLTGTPERRLLLAILERAILDFVGNDQIEVEQAKNWIFDNVETAGILPGTEISVEDQGHARLSPFSFPWVCQELDLDPRNISAIIAAMPRRGNRRVAPWYFNKANTPTSLKSAKATQSSSKKSPSDIEYSMREGRQLDAGGDVSEKSSKEPRASQNGSRKAAARVKHLRLVQTFREKSLRGKTQRTAQGLRKTLKGSVKIESTSNEGRLERVCA